MVLVFFLGACGSDAPAAVPSERPDTVSELIDEGFSADVASCVIGLADGEVPDETQSELIESCQRASDMMNTEEEPPPDLPFDQPSTYGDDPELDVLWDDCEAGSGTSCDLLWSNSPVGSEYEEFGVSCGNRPDVLNCAELTLAEPTEPAEPAQPTDD